MEEPAGRERALIVALSELAAGVQRSRSVIDVARVAADGLTALGFVPLIARRIGEGFELLPVGVASQILDELCRRGLSKTLLVTQEMKKLEGIARRRDVLYSERTATFLAENFAAGRPGEEVASFRAAMERLGFTRAFVCPLLVADDLWGVLAACSAETPKEDAPAVRLFGLQVASALEVAEAIESLERRNRIASAIHAIAGAAAETQLERLVPELLRIACDAMESDRATIYLLEPRGRWLEQAGVYGYSGRLDEDGRVELDTATGDVASSLRARAYHVATDWPEVNRADIVAEGLVEMAVIPLHVKRRPAGAMNLSRCAPRPYTAEEIDFASLIGEQIAIHVENARLVAAQRERVQALSLINEVGALVNERLELSAILGAGVQYLSEIADVTNTFVMLLDGRTGTLRTVATSAQEPSALKLTISLDGPSVALACIREARPVVIPDLMLDPRANQEAAARFGHRALVAVPLISGGRPFGAVVLGDTRGPREFAQEELERVVALSNQLATAIANAQLVDHLKTSCERLAKAHSELIERERLAALGELAALVAHEVRNSVGVIFNSLGPLKRQVPSGGDAGALLRILQEEAERLTAMVADFLDFARPNAPMLNRESLEEVVQAAVDVATSSHAPGDIEVSVQLPPDLPAVRIDARLLRQAFLNLVSNAIEASPRGGGVRIRARVEGERGSAALCVEVEDDGPGIPERVRDRLFQPFVTTKASGTGLGLAVVKRIVESHGGEVSVRSRAGHGTTFAVTFRSRSR